MSEEIVSIRGLYHTHLRTTPMAAVALLGANLTVRRGEIAALIGESGAGKSTLVQFLNALLRPAERGRVVVFGQDTASPDCDVATLRRRVGVVFQHPHQQLFERFLGDDVAYGPRQLGLSRTEVRERVQWAMEAVGLDFDAFVDRHTFSLSGGEMRRAALAGVLAMRPELLVLDEATTGLDPQGRTQLHALLRQLRDALGITILIISNDMDEVAELADQVTLLHRGRTMLTGTPQEVFRRFELLKTCNLGWPMATEIVHALREAGLPIERNVMTLADAEEAIWQAMRR